MRHLRTNILAEFKTFDGGRRVLEQVWVLREDPKVRSGKGKPQLSVGQTSSKENLRPDQRMDGHRGHREIKNNEAKTDDHDSSAATCLPVDPLPGSREST